MEAFDNKKVKFLLYNILPVRTHMIIFDPMLPEDILSLDITNLDSKSENFSFAYYLEYLLKYPNDFFTIRSFDIYTKMVSAMIYTSPVLAYLFAKKESKEELCLHLSAISVAPAYRKFKLGTKLMNLFEENGNFIKAHFSDLFVRSSNLVAISFYKKLGYTIYRTVFNYYFDPREHAFDMRKSLAKDLLKICEQKGKDIQSTELY